MESIRSRLGGNSRSQLQTSQRSSSPSRQCPSFSPNDSGQLSPSQLRRSSTISLDSLNDIIMPRPRSSHGLPSLHENLADDTGWASAPLAFALLPAIGGMAFKNGSAVISDILLLALAAIFLNWSVRLPWGWYQSTHEVRAVETYGETAVLDDDLDDWEQEGEDEDKDKDLPGGSEEDTAPSKSARRQRQLASYESSKKELYRHELIALLCCFAFPLLGAYLLHTIRDSLSRPSEGLVSNYNLTIFILAAELKPLSHLVKLVQARTLHLQRIVKDNPLASVDQKQDQDISGLRRQLASLKSLVESKTTPGPLPADLNSRAGEKDLQAVTKEVRRQLQPELDALNRAVRRYEKRAALQAMQTESRLYELNKRMDDAISLAAAASRGRESRGVVATGLRWVITLILLPWQVLGSVLQMPFNTIMGGLRGFGPGRRRTPPPPPQQARRKSAMKAGMERDRSVKRQL